MTEVYKSVVPAPDSTWEFILEKLGGDANSDFYGRLLEKFDSAG